MIFFLKCFIYTYFLQEHPNELKRENNSTNGRKYKKKLYDAVIENKLNKKKIYCALSLFSLKAAHANGIICVIFL